MKIAVRCKCCICGAEFIKEKEFRKRSDSYAWVNWAQQNCTVCGKCYREASAQRAHNRFLSICPELPELNGSPRQIVFAENLRKKYLEANRDKLEMLQGFLRNAELPPDWVLSDKRSKLTPESFAESYIKMKELDKAYSCLTEKNAGSLICLLKNKEE